MSTDWPRAFFSLAFQLRSQSLARNVVIGSLDVWMGGVLLQQMGPFFQVPLNRNFLKFVFKCY